jgi:hypothetical protein
MFALLRAFHGLSPWTKKFGTHLKTFGRLLHLLRIVFHGGDDEHEARSVDGISNPAYPGRRADRAGDSHQEIADILNRSLATVRGWRNIVREQGVAALAPKPRPGRTPKLHTQQRARLKRLLKHDATKFG